MNSRTGWFRWSAGVAAVAVVGGFAWWSTRAEARAPLGRDWPASQQISMDAIDHSSFDGLLEKYVDADGYVDYTGWHGSTQDRRTLRAYLDDLSKASTRLRATRAAQLAFWINAYNAVTLEGILQEYPTDSIRRHTSKIGGYNIWKHLPLRVGGTSYSLDAIEHRVLRPMGEPRIHFAIVCASVGCPRLRNEAYTADALDDQLADNATDFFARPQNLKVDAKTGTFSLSAILNWFGSDFGKTDAARLRTIAPYLPEEAKSLVDRRPTLRYLDYDWTLNDQKRKPKSARRR